MLTPEQLAALPGLLDASTPGDWKANMIRWPEQIGCCPLVGRPLSVASGAYNVAACNTEADARLIALAPELARAVLAAEVEKDRLRREYHWQKDREQELEARAEAAERALEAAREDYADLEREGMEMLARAEAAEAELARLRAERDGEDA